MPVDTYITYTTPEDLRNQVIDQAEKAMEAVDMAYESWASDGHWPTTVDPAVSRFQDLYNELDWLDLRGRHDAQIQPLRNRIRNYTKAVGLKQQMLNKIRSLERKAD